MYIDQTKRISSSSIELHKQEPSKNYTLSEGLHILELKDLRTLLKIPYGKWKLTFYLPKLTGCQIVFSKGDAIKLNTSKNFQPEYLFTSGNYEIFRDNCHEIFVSVNYYDKEKHTTAETIVKSTDKTYTSGNGGIR